MTLSQICAGLEYCKRLKTLGVKQQSLFAWYSTKPRREKDCYVESRELEKEISIYFPAFEICSAWTSDELLDMFQNFNDGIIYLEPYAGIFYARRMKTRNICDRRIEDDKASNALAKMLIEMLEQKLISVEDVNKSV